MRISVFGAGAWGTALAIQAAQRHEVLLWARDAAHADSLRQAGTNPRYLPGVALPPTLQVTSDWATAVRHADAGLAVLGTPMDALEAMLRALPAALPVVWLCKGFQAGTGRLGHEVAQAVRASGAAASGILSGPSFAQEVASGLPTAVVAASQDAALAAFVVDAFHGGNLRVYGSDDPIGVEVGGAVKNVFAIAAGISDGMGLGLNARAALITRGLAEMTRLGVAVGAKPATFTGLSGLGDLVLTATGDLSRNRQVGLKLAQGKRLPDILTELGHVAEGVYSAPTVAQRAQGLGVEMPIVQAVVQVLRGEQTPRQALTSLMARDARMEA